MNWFFIALISPLAYAIVNHFDKYLISKWMKDSPVGVLVVFSSLFAVVLLPVLLVIEPQLLTAASFWEGAILILNGVVYAGAVLLYLYALDSDEASYVIPLFQLVPVFGLLLSYLVLGEILNNNQFLAMSLIVVGSVILSIEFSVEQKAKFKTKLIALMVGSSLLFTINNVIFKYFTSDDGFVPSLFWNLLGMVCFGILVLIFDRKYRSQFLHLLKSHHYKIIGLNVLNESIGLVGEIATLFAILLAPIALVQAVSGLQPLFVLILGIFITLIFPKIGRESLLFHHLAQKILGIIIISAGLYYLTI